MKWFDKWFAKKCQEAWNRARESDCVPEKLSASSVRGNLDGEDGLNMRVINANGGRIVSFNHYDRRTDRHYSKLYVIHDELDFERELGKLITQESMR